MPVPHTARLLVLSLAGLLACAAGAPAADNAPSSAAEQQVRAAAKQYIEALRRNDARAMHDMWLPEGDIVDERGRARSAHEMIDAETQTRLADATGDKAPSTIDVVDTTIRFLTPDVAVEDGEVEVSNGPSGAPSLKGRFTVLWVKQDGKWRMASLREAPVATTTAGDLAGLDWMVGDWSGTSGDVTFDVATHWNAKHTLLQRDLKVTRDGQVLLNGEQRIGVDPLDGKIKSWVHDSEGGHGEGIWTRHGDNVWVVQAAGVLPDGRRTQTTNVYTYDGRDEITWKSTGGFSAGRATPDFEITLQRSPAGPQPGAAQPESRNP